MLIDTHCHLDFNDFEKDRNDVLQRASANGVKYIINVGTSPGSSLKSLNIARRYKNIFASVGVHPHYIGDFGDDEWPDIIKLTGENKVVAIGEVGLDCHRNPSTINKQMEIFGRFIGISKDRGLPLIIHNRDANSEILRMLREEGGRVKAVMHCFSQDDDFLFECLDMGLYISFTCNVTFKSAHRLRETASKVPLERLLMETDAPFLSPQTLRGKRNEPSNLTYLADALSDIMKVPREEIEERTSANATSFFNLDQE